MKGIQGAIRPTVGLAVVLLALASLVASPASAKQASCNDKRATIVGTGKSDHLVGTRRVDVIAGLGGGDRITRVSRADIVCGGGGKDKIVIRSRGSKPKSRSKEPRFIWLPPPIQIDFHGNVILGPGPDQVLISCSPDAEFEPGFENSIDGGPAADLIQPRS